jgi:hypothetical protein
MNILFTGSTAKQTDDSAYLRARVKRIDDSSIICNSLRKSGHNVTRKKIKWGEDLSQYDVSIIGVGMFGSQNYSGEIFASLYAIHKSKNVLLFFEDWKIKETMRSLTRILDEKTFNNDLKKVIGGLPFYGHIDDPNFDADIAKQVIKNIVDGKYNALIPAFNWGDKTLVKDILKCETVYNVDLTPYVLENWNIPLQVEPKPKVKKHMLASLVDHSRWVKKNKLTWQVDYFGTKSLKAPQLATETEVFEKSGEYCSILCPEYPHAGSGWFRIRYIYAAIHKCILLSSPKDLEALGLKKLRHFNIERCSDNDLQYYAEEQSKAILSYMCTKEQFDEKIDQIVNKEVNR